MNMKLAATFRGSPSAKRKNAMLKERSVLRTFLPLSCSLRNNGNQKHSNFDYYVALFQHTLLHEICLILIHISLQFYHCLQGCEKRFIGSWNRSFKYSIFSSYRTRQRFLCLPGSRTLRERSAFIVYDQLFNIDSVLELTSLVANIMFLSRKIYSSVFRRFSSSASSTLSEEEIDKFRKLANAWWDSKGPFKALHSLNKLR